MAKYKVERTNAPTESGNSRSPGSKSTRRSVSDVKPRCQFPLIGHVIFGRRSVCNMTGISGTVRRN